MAEGTAIEWADDSWNPIRARNLESGVIGHYCVKVSPGCKNCYAERLQAWPIGSRNRYAAQDLAKVEIFLDEQALEQPLRRRRARDIFPCSMTDLFMDQHPDEWLAKIFDVMYRASQHRFLVLTKRAERMRDFIVGRHGSGANAFAFRNVWFGVSAENQDAWDERAPFVHEMHELGFNTWASCEPLLGPIDTRGLHIGWAVLGGESGPGARMLDVHWIRSLIEQFRAGGTPVFVKQLGAKPITDHRTRPAGEPSYWTILLRHKKGGNPDEWPEDLRVREMPA